MRALVVTSLVFHSAHAEPFRRAGLESLPYPRSVVPTGGAGTIFPVDLASISEKADIVTLQSLAGVLARYSPVIFSLNNASAGASGDNTMFWLRQLQRTTSMSWSYEFMADLHGLLRHFRANISGYVRFSMQNTSTNSALIRCAAEPGNVIAVGTDSTAALLDGLAVPRIADVSSSTPLQEFQRSRFNLSTRMASFQPDDGRNSAFLSDYAVFGRFATVEQSEKGDGAFHAVLDHLDTAALNAGLGWGYDEHSLVASSNRAGAVVHASDFATNLGFLSNLPHSAHAPRRVNRGSRPIRSPVHTVASMMSDGDNIQLLEGDWLSERWFGSPLRGSVPMGWSYSAAVPVLMPNVMDWIHKSLTANDSLQAAPSGVGYAYPQLLPTGLKRSHAEVTAQLMDLSGMRLLNVLGVVPSAESLADFVAQPEIDGVVYFTFSVERSGYSALHGNVAYLNGKPVVSARMNLWGNASSGDRVGVDALVRELQTLPKDPGDPNSYSVIVVNMGSHGYADVVQAVRELEAAGGFDVVLPEELVDRLVKETHRTQQCPLPTGAWSSQCGDLPLCWIAGNGSCVMTCENLNSDERNIASCDLDVCSNLTLSPSFQHFVCGDGRACPPRTPGTILV